MTAVIVKIIVSVVLVGLGAGIGWWISPRRKRDDADL